MSRVDELKAALAVAELEEELVRLKAEPGDGKKLRKVKEQVRAARLEHRTAREQGND